MQSQFFPFQSHDYPFRPLPNHYTSTRTIYLQFVSWSLYPVAGKSDHKMHMIAENPYYKPLMLLNSYCYITSIPCITSPCRLSLRRFMALTFCSFRKTGWVVLVYYQQSHKKGTLLYAHFCKSLLQFFLDKLIHFLNFTNLVIFQRMAFNIRFSD